MSKTVGTFDAFLNAFNKDISKMDGVSTYDEPPRFWFGFGSHAINRVMSGSFYRGVPQGRITALCGPSSAGKSYLAGNLCREAQAEGAAVLVIDSENAFDRGFAGNIGIDTSREAGYTRVMVKTIQQATKIVQQYLEGYRAQFGTGEDLPKVLILVDSLDYLMTPAEAEAAEKGESQFDQGQHTRMLKSMLRTWVHLIRDINVSIVVTKQVYRARQDQLLQGEGAWVVNDAIRYACSQILLATRLKLKDESKDAKKSATGNIAGIRLKAQGFKTRFCAPFSEITVEVPYSTGMSPYSGMFDIAVALGVVTKNGSWYKIEGDAQNYRADDIEQSEVMMAKITERCEEKVDGVINTVKMLDDVVEDTANEGIKRGG